MNNGKSTAACSGTGTYDCIGVGFGPSNMALAISLQERGMLDRCLFLESQPEIDWHPGMLIEGTDIQHNPLRDLVTPRNPSSPYGFLSYLKAKDRLYDFLNLAAPFPPRTEYAGYVKWVGAQFSKWVKLATPVHSIRFVNGVAEQPAVEVISTSGDLYYAKCLSFGTGRSAHIPSQFQTLMGEDVVHLNDYQTAKERWLASYERPRVAVIGGSQSAAEIILDLSPQADVTGISRGFGFKHKDLSPFTECIYYPRFVDYFHSADVAGQRRMTEELWRSNYGAADPDVIAQLNMRIYEQKVAGRHSLNLLHNSEVVKVEENDSSYVLNLKEKYTGQTSSVECDGIVLATGFRNFGNLENQEPFHPLMADIAEHTTFRDDGGLAIDRNYRLITRNNANLPPLFVNGLCESSHGFGDAGSFSLLSNRSETIAAAIVDYLYENTALSATNWETKEVISA